jgi:adenylosuccinate lyase
MQRIAADEQKIRADLDSHWEVVSEGAQTILRAVGRSDAYEALKQQTRGRVLTESDYKSWVEALNVDESTREKLRLLSPSMYLGLAVELTDRITN